jgi:hypothetical protein
MGKYGTDGALLEIYSIGGSSDDFLYSMTLDDEDQLYLSGTFKDEMDIDPSENTNLITTSLTTPVLLVLKYSSAFDNVWSYFAGSGTNFGDAAIGTGIVGENIMVTGRFDTTVNFNPNGDEDVILQGGGGYLVKLTNPDIIIASLDEFAKNPLKVFPNPTQGKISISLNASMDVDQIMIYDLMGKCVYTKNVSALNAASSYTIELPELSPGTYFLSIEGKEKHTQSFIVSDSQ